MARKSQVVSPVKHADGNSEEDVDGDGSELELDDSDVDTATDGQILHLGSDLPEFPADSADSQASFGGSRPNAPVANMGNNNSRTELQKMADDTAAELRRRNALNKRPSTGKLKRVSSSAKNPISSPIVGTTSTLRKLGPSSVRPTSTYDFEEGSPEKHPPLQKRWEEDRPQFSPVRKERKKAQRKPSRLGVASSDPVEAEQQVQSSPRRSKRQEDVQQQARDIHVHAPKVRKRPAKAAQEDDDDVRATMDDTMYRDFFPDRGAQQYREEDTGAGAVDVEDEIEVADHAEEAIPHSSGGATKDRSPQPVPKPRGRPRKSDKAPEEPPKSPKKLGRPRKSDVSLPQPAAQTQEIRSPRKSTRQALNDDNPVGVQQSVSVFNQSRAGIDLPQSPAKQQSVRIPAYAKSALETPRLSTQINEKNSLEQSTRAPSQSPQRTRSARKSTSALENLRRRRSQIQDEYQPEDGEESADPSNDVNAAESPSKGLFVQNEDEENLPERPVAPRRPDHIRPDELYSDDSGEEDSQHQKSSPQKRKRTTPKSPAKANTRVKLTKATQSQQQVDEQATSTASRPGEHRIFGQWRALQKVFRDLELVGCNIGRDGVPQERNKIELRDEDVKATMKLCKKAAARFINLKDDPGSLASNDPATVLDEIGDRVDGLRGSNDELPTDFKNRSKSTDIYFHLIPRLVKLVRSAIRCYEAIDADQVDDGQITIGHLKIVTGMIKLILDLEKAAQNYARPGSELSVVRPVHSGIAVPLRSVYQAFARKIHQHHLQVEETQRKEEEAQSRALRLEQAERYSRQQANINNLRKKWQKLHQERMWVEEGISMSRQKRAHLQIPDHYVETDQNGRPFERAEVFLPRVGPPPGLVDDAAAREWSMVELSSLCDGLHEYAGPTVFERIFRRYCRRGGELNKYNVTEVVTTAAGLKDSLIQDRRNNGLDVEEWILGIPVWTKGQQALGKENEESVVDLFAES